MLKMKDLLEEGRKIQETFKKNVMKEEKIQSKFTPLLSIKDGGDYATLMTPFGSVTIETAGKYDTYRTDGDLSMSYSKPKGGITQTEWMRAVDKIYDYAVSERNYLKALEKLLDPKVLAKYLPKIKTIKETTNNSVVREATTKSKFTPLLSVRDNGDSATLVTPFGNITIETAGEYDTFNSYSDPSMSYTNPKRGISQSEWRSIADDIFDYATSERNYRKALEKLLDPKVLAKYIPKIKTLVK